MNRKRSKSPLTKINLKKKRKNKQPEQIAKDHEIFVLSEKSNRKKIRRNFKGKKKEKEAKKKKKKKKKKKHKQRKKEKENETEHENKKEKENSVQELIEISSSDYVLENTMNDYIDLELYFKESGGKNNQNKHSICQPINPESEEENLRPFEELGTNERLELLKKTNINDLVKEELKQKDLETIISVILNSKIILTDKVIKKQIDKTLKTNHSPIKKVLPNTKKREKLKRTLIEKLLISYNANLYKEDEDELGEKEKNQLPLLFSKPETITKKQLRSLSFHELKQLASVYQIINPTRKKHSLLQTLKIHSFTLEKLRTKCFKKRESILGCRKELARRLLALKIFQKQSLWGSDLFPSEILLHCFGYLSPKHLSKVALTCSHWNSISSDNTIWRNIAKQLFKPNDPIFYHEKNILNDEKKEKHNDDEVIVVLDDDNDDEDEDDNFGGDGDDYDNNDDDDDHDHDNEMEKNEIGYLNGNKILWKKLISKRMSRCCYLCSSKTRDTFLNWGDYFCKKCLGGIQNSEINRTQLLKSYPLNKIDSNRIPHDQRHYRKFRYSGTTYMYKVTRVYDEIYHIYGSLTFAERFPRSKNIHSELLNYGILELPFSPKSPIKSKKITSLFMDYCVNKRNISLKAICKKYSKQYFAKITEKKLMDLISLYFANYPSLKSHLEKLVDFNRIKDLNINPLLIIRKKVIVYMRELRCEKLDKELLKVNIIKNSSEIFDKIIQNSDSYRKFILTEIPFTNIYGIRKLFKFNSELFEKTDFEKLVQTCLNEVL
ncbi:hypothetical protein M0812_27358 [Anaeramoeba flamelloides]|uniref:F-box domain-containing protein n=1 Tax=Anaeramoeba flamelloides TaxID=1746091 RepID=A0AAV7Y9Y8_9EUKA|nr:hypothetical protein M0812_27358 [Anaeramoeba flamelloides]